MTPGLDFFEEIERAVRESIPKPKMMILGFPSNPTAQCVDLAFFERIIALAKEHNILVVHDLAYADITFDGYQAPSIMQVEGARDVAVEFFTMSKSYNRSEEHTSELQSLMRNSYAVFCLKKKKYTQQPPHNYIHSTK